MFCDKPGKIADGSKVNRTCNFYGNWKADLACECESGTTSVKARSRWAFKCSHG